MINCVYVCVCVCLRQKVSVFLLCVFGRECVCVSICVRASVYVCVLFSL